MKHMFMGAVGALALVAVLAGTIPAFAAPTLAAPPSMEAFWLNPHNSVVVRTGPCGAHLCGWIIWADKEARDDARDGGVDRLVGTQLLENYSYQGKGRWSGTVYVPDMGHSFASQIEQMPAGRMKVKGCILGGLLCKSQIWTRIDAVPSGDGPVHPEARPDARRGT